MSLRDLVTARSRSRSTTTSFIGLLDEHLTTAEQKPRRPGFHPSQLSYDFCPRFYTLLGLGLLIGIKVIDARLQRIFDNGHALHDRYQKYTRDMGIVFDHPVLKRRGKRVGRQKFAQEVRLDHPVGITGNCDDVLFVDGFLEVVDYKSINPQRFGALLAPTESHEKQLTIYVGLMSHLFDGRPPRPLRGRMVYEDKSTQALKEFIVPWDDDHRAWFDQLIEYLEIVNQAVEQDTPELAPCTCGKCDAYDIKALRAKPKEVKL